MASLLGVPSIREYEVQKCVIVDNRVLHTQDSFQTALDFKICYERGGRW